MTGTIILNQAVLIANIMEDKMYLSSSFST